MHRWPDTRNIEKSASPADDSTVALTMGQRLLQSPGSHASGPASAEVRRNFRYPGSQADHLHHSLDIANSL